MFEKKFIDTRPELITHLANNVKKACDATRKYPNAIIPHVIKAAKDSIIYETVDCSVSLLDSINIKQVNKELLYAGQVLALLHKNKIYHQDYVPHNIFCSPSKIVIIDFHPPECFMNYKYVKQLESVDEYVGFIFCMITDYGIKNAVANHSYINNLVDDFKKGYDFKEYSYFNKVKASLKYSRNVYKVKKYAGFSMLHTLLHCFAGLIVTLFFIK